MPTSKPMLETTQILELLELNLEAAIIAEDDYFWAAKPFSYLVWREKFMDVIRCKRLLQERLAEKEAWDQIVDPVDGA